MAAFLLVVVPGLGSIEEGRLAQRDDSARSAPVTVRNVIDSRPVEVAVSQAELPQVEADLLAVGLREGEELPTALADARGAADAKAAFKQIAILHPEVPARVLVVGLGKREELDAERLRV